MKTEWEIGPVTRAEKAETQLELLRQGVDQIATRIGDSHPLISRDLLALLQEDRPESHKGDEGVSK